MNEPESGSTPSPAPTSSVPQAPADAAARGRRLPPVAAAMAAGVLAAGLGWLACEPAVGHFAPETLLDPMKGPTAGAASLEDIRRGRVLDATLIFGIQGAALGLLLGLAGGVAGGSGRRGAVGGVAGLLLGGLLGAGAAYGIFTVSVAHINPNANDLLLPMAAHAGAFAAVGLAGGLAFGLGLGGGASRVAKAAVGGLIGAAIGAAAYEVVGAILFPTARTSDPVAEQATARLLAHAATAVLAALVAAMSVSESRRPAAR